MIKTTDNKDMSIQDDFQSLNNKSELADVLKELFDEKKISMIGDLTKDEIKIITRIYMISEIKNIPVWQKGLAVYSKLLLSKNRQSRKEIIDAVKGHNMQSSSLMSKLNPMNWINNNR